MASQGVVLEVQLCVQRQELALLRENEGVDLGEGAVLGLEHAIQVGDQGRAGANQLARETQAVCEVAALEGLQP